MDVSGLTNLEFVSLVAHYNSLWDDNLNYNEISDQVSTRGYSEAALEEVRKHNRLAFTSIKSCGLEFTRPFNHLRFDQLSYALLLLENYERGRLPFPGSVSEQPAQIMEIFSVISRVRQEREAKASEKLKVDGRNKHKNKPRTR